MLCTVDLMPEVKTRIFLKVSAEKDFKCNHCFQTFSNFNEIIDHNIIYHSEVQLKFKRRVQGSDRNTYFWQTKSSSVTPIDIKDNGCFIYPEASTETIKISKLGKAEDSFLLSPIRANLWWIKRA